MSQTAFVQTTYRRKRHIGYSVFVEWTEKDTGFKHGRHVKTFELKDHNGNADVALHLANILRDGINKDC